jgi:FkbM family methyltransferase
MQVVDRLKKKVPVRKILKYKNWKDVHKEISQGGAPKRLEYRNGYVFDAPGESTVIEIIDEIIYKKDYNPKGFTIGPDDIVVDIGANIGIFSVYAAKKAKAVYAVEPFPENVSFIKKNAKNNKLKNITTIHAAVSDKKGKINLFISNISAGHLIFNKHSGGSLSEYVTVPSVTLAEIMKKHNLKKIDFLKIDREGAEGQIIKSLSEIDLQKISKITMEFHDNVSKPSHLGIKKILEKAGFEVHCLEYDKSPFGYLYAKRTA